MQFENLKVHAQEIRLRTSNVSLTSHVPFNFSKLLIFFIIVIQNHNQNPVRIKSKSFPSVTLQKFHQKQSTSISQSTQSSQNRLSFLNFSMRTNSIDFLQFIYLLLYYIRSSKITSIERKLQQHDDNSREYDRTCKQLKKTLQKKKLSAAHHFNPSAKKMLLKQNHKTTPHHFHIQCLKIEIYCFEKQKS